MTEKFVIYESVNHSTEDEEAIFSGALTAGGQVHARFREVDNSDPSGKTALGTAFTHQTEGKLKLAVGMLDPAIWSKWRSTSNGRNPEINNTVFCVALRGLSFDDTVLTDCVFTGSEIRDCTFHRATLINVKFRGTLAGVNFGRAILKAVVFYDKLRLENCELPNAELENCSFDEGTFDSCDLSRAKFREVNLRGVDFGYSPVRLVEFVNCDMRDTRRLCLDENFLLHNTSSPYISEPWSRLRRSYTGPRMAFNLIFLATFFTPLLLSSFFWLEVNRAERVAGAEIGALRTALTSSLSISRAESRVIRSVVRRLDEIRLCPGYGCRQYSIWQLVLGVQRQGSFWIFSALLIAYNIGRLVLTFVVGPLRAEEDRSAHTPPRWPALSTEGKWCVRVARWVSQLNTCYAWLVPIHWFVFVMGFAALAAAIINGSRLLTTSVFLPT